MQHASGALLSLTVRPEARESLFSYFARLTAVHEMPTGMFLSDMGTSLKEVVLNVREGAQLAGRLAGLSEQEVDELASWTGCRVGDVRAEFRNEIYVSRALRNPIFRGCPICIRHAARTAPGGDPKRAVWFLGDWMFRGVSLCLKHRHPLVPLWNVIAQYWRYDVAEQLQEILPAIMAGKLDRPRREPSKYDLWLDRRLGGDLGDGWLSDKSTYAICTFSHLLGEDILKWRNDETTVEFERQCKAQSIGFDAVASGEEGIRRALEMISRNAVGHTGCFSNLYSTLNENYATDPNFTPFTDLLHDFIVKNWAIDPSDSIMGRKIEARLLHSVSSAAKEYGLHPRRVDTLLTAAGVFEEGDHRPASRKLFDPNQYAHLMLSGEPLVSGKTIQSEFGFTREQFDSLVEAIILRPAIASQGGRKVWSRSATKAFMDQLSRVAPIVEHEDEEWLPIGLAAFRGGLKVSHIVRYALAGAIGITRVKDSAAFGDFRVALADVRRWADEATELRHKDRKDETLVSLTKAARSFGLPQSTELLKLVKDGLVPVSKRVDHPSGKTEAWMSLKDRLEFKRKFVTVATAVDEFGLSRNQVIGALNGSGISPILVGPNNAGKIWVRGGVFSVLDECRNK